MENTETELKIKNLVEDISEIKSELRALPETITKSLTETINLKIDLAIKDLEMRFFKYITGLAIGVLSTGAGLIIKYILDGVAK